MSPQPRYTRRAALTAGLVSLSSGCIGQSLKPNMTKYVVSPISCGQPELRQRGKVFCSNSSIDSLDVRWNLTISNNESPAPRLVFTLTNENTDALALSPAQWLLWERTEEDEWRYRFQGEMLQPRYLIETSEKWSWEIPLTEDANDEDLPTTPDQQYHWEENTAEVTAVHCPPGNYLFGIIDTGFSDSEDYILTTPFSVSSASE